MRKLFFAGLVFSVMSLPALSAQAQTLYKWVDENGVVHYGDSVPPEFADNEKEIVNKEGVTVDRLRGKMTEEELAEQKRLEELRIQKELQARSDQALLATYLSVEEIQLHRDRRIELFQAQSRVTELYLRNLHRRLDSLHTEMQRYRPYNDDPNAPLIDRELMDEVNTTKETIERHEGNLLRYRNDEQRIHARFANDIERFRQLRGID
ncbi:MAG TPA: DUF4124 domain-containing protein [Woeseiaceae bacterium]